MIVEGIVVGDFQDGAAGVNGDLNGFFVQEEDADADGDPGRLRASSSSTAVHLRSTSRSATWCGSRATSSEFNGLTEITSFSGVTVLSSGNPLPTAASGLPAGRQSSMTSRRSRGCRSTFPQDLVISEYFNFDRFGEIVADLDSAT